MAPGTAATPDRALALAGRGAVAVSLVASLLRGGQRSWRRKQSRSAPIFCVVLPPPPGCGDGVLFFWGRLSPWPGHHSIEGARG